MRVRGGETHICHTIGATGGQKNGESGSCVCTGLTAADTFSHESEFGGFVLLLCLYPVGIMEPIEL